MGVMLYEMVTGQMPYYADTPFAVVMKHVNEPLPSLRRFNPDLPEALEEVIYKALAKRTDLRYQSASELLDALEQAHSTLNHPAKTRFARRGIVSLPSDATPMLGAETRPLSTAVTCPVNQTRNAPAAVGEEKRRRRRSLAFTCFVLFLCGFAVLRGDGVFNVSAQPTTEAQPALVVTEATFTQTPSPYPTRTASA